MTVSWALELTLVGLGELTQISSQKSEDSMKQQDFQRPGFLRRLCLQLVLLGLAISIAVPSSAAQSQNKPTSTPLDSDAYTTTVAYVEQFYPLWFTYYQFRFGAPLGATNAWVADKEVTPLYHFCVAINDDTLYTSVYFDLRAEPVVVTIPSTNLKYTTLTLDPYGTTIEPGLPTTPGVYAFTGPGFTGTLPLGITAVPMPINFPSLYIRTIKYSPSGENLIAAGQAFQKSLLAQPLSQYLSNPDGGAANILPEVDFAFPFKQTADKLIRKSPILFLKQLQAAVAAPNTPPLSQSAQALSNRFNALFGNGDNQQAMFSAGARDAHTMIVQNYITNTDPSYWIHYTNISNWGSNFLDRSSITEFLQLSNGISTAAYYHTFSDGKGNALDGSDPGGYVLSFSKDQLPQAGLFWSLTAYTPHAIELVPNNANKYVVASYLPELQYNADGSLNVYLSTQQPDGVPAANWLPIPSGKFNVMLRVYGPEGDVADNTYVPPAIQKQ